jgi:hypothetical protein
MKIVASNRLESLLKIKTISLEVFGKIGILKLKKSDEP